MPNLAVPTPEFSLVESVAELAEIEQETLIAVDTETTHLNPHLGEIRLIQIATGDQVFVIDTWRIPMAELTQTLNPVFSNPAITKIIQNACFDLSWLWQNGFDIRPPLFDPMLAEQVLRMGESNYKANLQALVSRHLKQYLPKEEQVSDWSNPQLTQEQISYGARDAAVLMPLYQAMAAELEKEKLTHVAKLEFEAVPAIAEMQWQGLPFDWEGLAEMTVKLAQLTDQLENEALALFSKIPQPTEQLTLAFAGFEGKAFSDINLNSPKQVQNLLSRELGTELESVDQKVLSHHIENPTVQAYLNFKECSTHLSKLQKLTDHRNPATSRIHASFTQISPASAGRMACRNPNVQNLSAHPFPTGDRLRSLVKAPPGYRLIIADYSQIELRIAAELSRDKRLIEAYNNGEDIHKLTASLVLNVPLDAVTKEQRSTAKPVNFGFLYGSGADGFRAFALSAYGLNFSRSEAEKLRAGYFKSYPGLKGWVTLAKVKSQSAKFLTTRFGRRRILEPAKRSLTVCANTPVQGLGADILKRAMALLWERLYQTEAYLINSVHDELVILCPDHLAEATRDIVKTTMEEAGKEFLHLVPVVAEAAIANDWSEK
jgi:DNA polymerase I-like protein with 3'-5' exonuclease and polymerase domains